MAPEPLLAVELRPVGTTAIGIADDVVRRLSRHISVPCRRGSPLALDTFPMLEHRQQADADALLARIEREPRDVHTTLVALVGVDLGHPLFTYFFGRARVGGCALVSTARLDPRSDGRPADHATLIRRTAAECFHELGHTVGLLHCPDFACVMRFTGDTEMLDLRGERLCDACAAAAPQGLCRPRFGAFSSRLGRALVRRRPDP